MDEQNPVHEDDTTEWLRGLEEASPEAPLPATPSGGGHPPSLDRPRPPRQPLVSRRSWIIIAAAVALPLLGVVVALVVSSATQLEVPNIVGRDVNVARTELARFGLELRVTGERFSPQPEDEVIEQQPAPSSRVRRGSVVTVVTSAGTGEFAMPDVVGDGIALATGSLESMGLVVEVESVVSEAASDTVVSTTPAAGAVVRTGDVVRIQIASPRSGGATLQPYRMDGLVFVIDPAPDRAGSLDPSLEVARRLRSLLEASGASVTLLRSTSDSATTEADRAVRASDTSATAGVGLGLRADGEGGRIVSSPPSDTVGPAPVSELIAASVHQRLTSVTPPSERRITTSDPVLSARNPWIRVSLGSASARDDTTAFADPGWADSVARALYAALGETVGQAVSP